MTGLRRMLQRSLRGAGRSSVLLRWTERWAERTAADPQGGQGGQSAKSLDQMPGPSVASFAWDLFARRGLSRLHELQLEGRRRYGPVWLASFGPVVTVHVADPVLIEQVLRQEGRHPMRSDLSPWKDYRKLRGHDLGLLTAEGAEWQEVRRLLGKHLLRPQAVEAYDQTLNAVVDDLIAKLRLRRRSQDLVSDIAGEFYRFGLEGISSVLFESRIGCLDPVVPVETERFIQSISTMFVMTLVTMAMPRWLHRLFPKPWNIFCRCWDDMFAFAKVHIDQRLTAEVEKAEPGEKVERRYLTYFLSQELPMKSVYSNVTELLLAGVDTISSTLSWSLYELSRHAGLQEELRDEVLRVLEGRGKATAADVARMPLMKATVREVLRLYPVIPANARVLADRDLQLGGFLIPKNTLITLCHFATSRDPAVFQNPDQFQPRRWLKKQHHPFSSVPFGAGKRSCVGRRVAELELYLALSRILLEFDVKPDPDGASVKPMTRTLLVPEDVINLRFIQR